MKKDNYNITIVIITVSILIFGTYLIKVSFKKAPELSNENIESLKNAISETIDEGFNDVENKMKKEYEKLLTQQNDLITIHDLSNVRAASSTIIRESSNGMKETVPATVIKHIISYAQGGNKKQIRITGYIAVIVPVIISLVLCLFKLRVDSSQIKLLKLQIRELEDKQKAEK